MRSYDGDAMYYPIMFFCVFKTPWGYIPENNRVAEVATALSGEEIVFRDLEQGPCFYKVYDDETMPRRALYHLVNGLEESHTYVWLLWGDTTYQQDGEVMDEDTAAVALLSCPELDRVAISDLDDIDPRLADAVRRQEARGE